MLSSIDALPDEEYARRVLEDMFACGARYWEAVARTDLIYGHRWKWGMDEPGCFGLSLDRSQHVSALRWECRAENCRQLFALHQDAITHERDHIEDWYAKRRAFLPWRERATALVLGDALSLACATLAAVHRAANL